MTLMVAYHLPIRKFMRWTWMSRYLSYPFTYKNLLLPPWIELTSTARSMWRCWTLLNASWESTCVTWWGPRSGPVGRHLCQDILVRKDTNLRWEHVCSLHFDVWYLCIKLYFLMMYEYIMFGSYRCTTTWHAPRTFIPFRLPPQIASKLVGGLVVPTPMAHPWEWYIYLQPNGCFLW